jgi:Zn-dependent protease with chaperone function
MDSAPADGLPRLEAAAQAVYFDGRSNRRRLVTLGFKNELELSEPLQPTIAWPYSDIRKLDSPSGMLRLSCLTAPDLARLEIRDTAVAAELIPRCAHLDDNRPNRHGVAVIAFWSIAAAASIIGVVWFGMPLVADRLAPLVPQAVERRIGDVAEKQIKTLFGGRVCDAAAGQAAFAKLVHTLRQSAGMDTAVEAAVLATPVPNAFALPGGKVYVFDGLLAKANSADEIAGILAHELGHLRHRDAMRNLIYNGGTSFLIGLLFGDITGSGALIFASRSLVTASYSREAEQNADGFAIEMMTKLGRSPKPMGQLLLRVTGKQADNSLSILSSHPMTEDRLARMASEDRPPSGPALLTADEWMALKSICHSGERL